MFRLMKMDRFSVVIRLMCDVIEQGRFFGMRFVRFFWRSVEIKNLFVLGLLMEYRKSGMISVARSFRRRPGHVNEAATVVGDYTSYRKVKSLI